MMISRLLRRLGASKPEAQRTDVGDPAVRRADIARLDDPDALLACLDDPGLATAARRRLGQLFDAGLDPLALIEVADSIARRRQLLDAVTRERHWRPLLAGLHGDDLLADVACRHPLAPVRLAAAERLLDEAALRRVEKICRDRDKTVARLMRERLDELRHARSRVAEIDARLEALTADLTQLARLEDEPHLEERLNWLLQQQQTQLQQRSSLAAPFEQCGQNLPEQPESVAVFATTAAAMRDRLAQLRAQAEAAAEAAALRETAAADQTAVVTAVERLLEQIRERLEEDPSASEDRNQWRAAATLEQGRWEDVCRRVQPEPELERRYEAAAETLIRILAACEHLNTLPAPPALPEGADMEAVAAARAACRAALDALDWPEDCPAPAPVQTIKRAEAEFDARLADEQRQQRRSAAELKRQLPRLDRAIEQGRMRQARAIRADVERLLDQAALGASDRLRQRSDAVLARLDDLADWQRFVTAPKRQELCTAMEALAEDADLAPEPRAARVKHLREQWNELGPARDRESRVLGERFDAAAERAFAPARHFFEATAERQRFNADNRRRICDELAAFIEGYDWDAADWRAVERIYQHARREWRRYADVDARERGLGKQYHALMRTFRERLDARWQANIATKEALVAAAEALLASPDANSAAEARKLQREWKQVDITPRSVDRKLWDAFRSACDGIFTQLEEQTRAAEATFEAGIEALQKEIDALAERCLAQRRRPLLEREVPGAEALRELENRLRELADSAPGAVHKRLQPLERSLAQLRSDLRDLSRETLHRDELLAAQATLAKCVRDGEASPDARAAVIDLELALGLDSPEGDAPLRLERQVKRLESGLRGAADEDPLAATLETLARRGANGELIERARRAIATALAQTP